jgi:hypothetical protein
MIEMLLTIIHYAVYAIAAMGAIFFLVSAGFVFWQLRDHKQERPQ